MSDKQSAKEEARRRWPESDPVFFLGLSIDAERSFLVQRQAFEEGARWQRGRGTSGDDVERLHDYLRERENEIVRLRTVIENQPHDAHCWSLPDVMGVSDACTCWKANAL